MSVDNENILRKNENNVYDRFNVSIKIVQSQWNSLLSLAENISAYTNSNPNYNLFINTDYS